MLRLGAADRPSPVLPDAAIEAQAFPRERLQRQVWPVSTKNSPATQAGL